MAATEASADRSQRGACPGPSQDAVYAEPYQDAVRPEPSQDAVRSEQPSPRRNAWAAGTAGTLVRGAFFLAAVVLGFLLLELPWNTDVFAISWDYVLPNLLIGLLACGVVYLIGQRTRASLAVYVGLCLVAGCANFFIITFKGQPIVPADLFALSTAASVAGGYSLFLTGWLVFCIALFAAFCVALWKLCPARPIGAVNFGANCVAAVLLVALGFMQYNAIDIKSDCDVKVDVWDVRGSYATQGTALCFLSRTQELTPAKPENYSPETLDTILGPYNGTFPLAQAASNSNAQPQEASQSTEVKPYDGPNVIAIMNETFSDLSSYPGMEEAAFVTENFHDIAADALVSGDVYVSAMGGGTCNSEFEFLTGSSMGNMGGGVYPYVLYDLDGASNLAAYFDALGYDTHAIHPAEASNWRRDRIYSQLGFQTFDDITTMEGADTFRNLTTDKATYERVLQKIDEGEGPQFVFDVTIQNHGGYDTGLVPAEDAVHVEAAHSAEVDEFLASIKQSDEDLRWLIDELNAHEEPTVVVFFGDHQPGFVDELFQTTFGKSVDDATLNEVQERYHTPYLIWANKAAREQYGDRLTAIENADVTSLNYLGTLLVDAAGLPSTVHTRYLDALREELPAVNLNGYRDAEGVWHWFGEDVTSDAQDEANKALKSYRIVQYDNLFNKDSAFSEA